MGDSQSPDPKPDNPTAVEKEAGEAASKQETDDSLLTDGADAGESGGASSTDAADSTDAPGEATALPDSLKSNPAMGKFKSVESLAKSYAELEKRLGKAVVLPGKDASREDWEKYHNMVRPKNQEGYELDTVKLPAGYEADEQMTTGFRKLAYAHGLSDKQAREVFGFLSSAVHAEAQKPAVRITKAEAEAMLKNDEEYGGSNYELSTEYRKRGYRQFGTPELTAILNKTGLGNHPEINKMFTRIGKAIQESRFRTGSQNTIPSPNTFGKRTTAELAETMYPPKQ